MSESDSTDVNALASLLKLYLRELQDPLIPYELYEDFVGAIRTSLRDSRVPILGF